MGSINQLRVAFLLGLLLAAVFASSIVAWQFGWAHELGRPWFGWFYDPRAVWRWWHAWGYRDGYRQIFQSGLTLTVLPALAPAGAVLLYQLAAPLPVGKDPTRNADFGTARKLLRTGHVVRRGDGVVLGGDPDRWRWRQRTLRDHGDGHVLIMGPSRQGKGANNVVPTLLGHSGSVLAFDPKGELEKITGRRRAKFGPVYVVDPTDTRRASFNPLLELRKDRHLIGDCQMVAQIICSDGAASTQGGAKDPFFDAAAGKLLAALLVHVVGSNEPTLGHVWRLSLEVARNRFPVATDPYVKASLAAHKKMEGRTRSSVEETLNTHLHFLADPLIRMMTATSDFRAGDLVAGERPVTVFLAPPVSDGRRLRPLIRLMLEGIVAALTTHLKHTSDGRVKERGVLALIDEFPQLGRLDVIERQMPIMASYGVRLALVCQDEDQIGGLYGAKQAITANCSTICYIAGFSGNSLQTVARWGGQHAVAHSSKQLPFGLRGSSAVTQSETRTALLESGEMLQRSKDEILVFTHGVPPTYLRKLRYWKEREFRGRWDEQPVDLLPPLPLKLPIEPGFDTILPLEDDDLSEDDAAMVASVEDLLRDMPAAAQAALRQRLQ